MQQDGPCLDQTRLPAAAARASLSQPGLTGERRLRGTLSSHLVFQPLGPVLRHCRQWLPLFYYVPGTMLGPSVTERGKKKKTKKTKNRRSSLPRGSYSLATAKRQETREICKCCWLLGWQERGMLITEG